MFNRQFLGKIGIALVVIISLIIGAVGDEYIGYFWEDIQLSNQMATDPRYQIVQEVEAGCFNDLCGGLYVVDILVEEPDTGGTAAVIYLMFDSRMVDALKEREYDEELERQPISVFVEEANVAIIDIMTRIGGYDWIGLSYVYPYPVETFDGTHWVSDILFLVYGTTETMGLWADDGGSQTALQSYIYTQKLEYYVLTPVETPKRFTNTLPRLHRDGTPVWVLVWEYELAQREVE